MDTQHVDHIDTSEIRTFRDSANDQGPAAELFRRALSGHHYSFAVRAYIKGISASSPFSVEGRRSSRSDFGISRLFVASATVISSSP